MVISSRFTNRLDRLPATVYNIFNPVIGLHTYAVIYNVLYFLNNPYKIRYSSVFLHSCIPFQNIAEFQTPLIIFVFIEID